MKSSKHISDTKEEIEYQKRLHLNSNIRTAKNFREMNLVEAFKKVCFTEWRKDFIRLRCSFY